MGVSLVASPSRLIIPPRGPVELHQGHPAKHAPPPEREAISSSSRRSLANSCPVLASTPSLLTARDTLGTDTSEIAVLSLQKETDRLEICGARSLLRAIGTKLAADHRSRLAEIRRLKEAAGKKHFWQKLLTVFKYLSIAAGALSGGTLGLCAAALVTIALLVEKKAPRVALALNIAAAAISLGDAARCAVRAISTASQGALASASPGLMSRVGALVDKVTAPLTSLVRASQPWIRISAAACSAGAAVSSGGAAHASAEEMSSQAQGLLASRRCEQDREDAREEIHLARSVSETDIRATRALSDIAAKRADSMLAPLRA
jgi:hypothetical protein